MVFGKFWFFGGVVFGLLILIFNFILIREHFISKGVEPYISGKVSKCTNDGIYLTLDSLSNNRWRNFFDFFGGLKREVIWVGYSNKGLVTTTSRMRSGLVAGLDGKNLCRENSSVTVVRYYKDGSGGYIGEMVIFNDGNFNELSPILIKKM